MANILIVEDEKAMQDIITDYMRKGGHTCFAADDGIDALVTLKNHPLDLMILDVRMPHLDGFSVCRMAREMSDIPIIMLTAKSAEDDKLKGYDYGADDYMTKPFSPKVLLANERPPAPFLPRFCRSDHRRENHAPPQRTQSLSGRSGDLFDAQGV